MATLRAVKKQRKVKAVAQLEAATLRAVMRQKKMKASSSTPTQETEPLVFRVGASQQMSLSGNVLTPL